MQLDDPTFEVSEITWPSPLQGTASAPGCNRRAPVAAVTGHSTRLMYPARKKSRWKPNRKALGSVYGVGGGLVGHFDARYVWGRYGGDLGSYEAGVASDSSGRRVGIIRGRTLIHEM